MNAELFNMEVRAFADDRLLGWLLVPLDVYQGAHESWSFELRHRYGVQSVRRVRLPIIRYATHTGRAWWAFRATSAEMRLLREVAVFASAA